MMNFWLEKGIGGFRMDVIDLIGKEVDQKITSNGPRLHPLLQEMNQATFGNYDVLTVGETWGATPEIAKLYSGPERNELSMIFQFEHMTIDWDDEEGKWRPKPLDFEKLKQILSKWQTELKGQGWNSLFWNNHDLPRIVSRWGNDKGYRVESAKMLATLLHFMQGTPYIYQGEEIGMTNVKYESIDDYNDIEILNFYRDNLKKGYTHQQMMEAIWQNGRDNARTPIQWDDSENAGFTVGTPWLKVNPNYTEVNVEEALNNSDSIFYYYQKLIRLRKENDVIVYGDYQLLLEDDDSIFAYTRTLADEQILVIVNFFKAEAEFILPEDISFDNKELLISNYEIDEDESIDKVELKPYEARAYRLI
jgi:glycosidase